MNEKVVRLDVREDLRQGREPFSKIMRTVAHLKEEESLLLVAPFEPVPLFHVLGGQGFAHQATQLDSGDWEVLFSRDTPTAPPLRPEPATTSQEPPVEVIQIDARGWEPPQPLVKILECLTTLPCGATLQAQTDRRPIHLFPHLAERGFAATTEEQSDGSYLTHITRA